MSLSGNDENLDTFAPYVYGVDMKGGGRDFVSDRAVKYLEIRCKEKTYNMRYPLHGFLTFTQYSDIVEYTGNNEGGRSW